MIRYLSSSAADTAEMGAKLGSILKKGDLVCLTGNLGTGKTAFTKGIAEALGITGHITSPTFTIVNEYKARIPLYHFDVYRISDVEEMFEIGFEEYLDGAGIVVVEWADMIREILPAECIRVELKKDLSAGPDVRIVDIVFKGDRYGEYEDRMKNVQ